MNTLKSYYFILSKEIFSWAMLVYSLGYALFFLFITLLLVTIQSDISILKSDIDFSPKIKILFIVIIGGFFAISPLDRVFVVVISVLFGINLYIVVQKLRELKKQGSLRLAFGAGLVSVVAAGCASCGLSVASLIGLSGVLVLLPFGGVELYVLSIVLLVAVLFYNLSTVYKSCVIKR